MKTVQQIKRAVRQLSPPDLVKFRAWFTELDADAWDKQFEQDVLNWRLDKLGEETLADLRKGRCKPLDQSFRSGL